MMMMMIVNIIINSEIIVTLSWNRCRGTVRNSNHMPEKVSAT